MVQEKTNRKHHTQKYFVVSLNHEKYVCIYEYWLFCQNVCKNDKKKPKKDLKNVRIQFLHGVEKFKFKISNFIYYICV